MSWRIWEDRGKTRQASGFEALWGWGGGGGGDGENRLRDVFFSIVTLTTKLFVFGLY